MPQDTARGYTYPVYTDPANFPAQIQDLAQDIDLDMESLFDRVVAGNNQPACHIVASGVNQAIAVNTDVNATFVTEVYDNDNMVNLGADATLVTLTESGIYIATGRSTFLSNGNATINSRQLVLLTNGPNLTVGRKSLQGDQNVATAVQLTVNFQASAGNTLRMPQRQNSGASLNTSTRTLQVAKVSEL
jgi:hypothetical protein